jgi:methylated-DNA-[protein]-cysteine S-methyltransferase
MLKRTGATFIQVDQTKTTDEVQQISEYLLGERETFDLPIDWSGLTPFQEKALRATFDIPYGEVKTYGEIASQLGNPRAARAVGRAEATNPMPLVIPCHRVIGADGGLHGYGAGQGLETKAWLLKLEAKD